MGRDRHHHHPPRKLDTRTVAGAAVVAAATLFAFLLLPVGGCAEAPKRNPYRDARIAREYRDRALAHDPFSPVHQRPGDDTPSIRPADPDRPQSEAELRLARFTEALEAESTANRVLARDTLDSFASSGGHRPHDDDPTTRAELSEPAALALDVALAALAREVEPAGAEAAVAAELGPPGPKRALSALLGQLDSLLSPLVPLAASAQLDRTAALVRPIAEAALAMWRDDARAGELWHVALGVLVCVAARGDLPFLVDLLAEEDARTRAVALSGLLERAEPYSLAELRDLVVQLINLLDPTDLIERCRNLIVFGDPPSIRACTETLLALAMDLDFALPDVAGAVAEAESLLAYAALVPAVERTPFLEHATDLLAPFVSERPGMPARFVIVAALRRLTGQSFRYRPEAPEHARRLAVARWQIWLKTPGALTPPPSTPETAITPNAGSATSPATDNATVDPR